jgi:hypothetical protein
MITVLDKLNECTTIKEIQNLIEYIDYDLLYIIDEIYDDFNTKIENYSLDEIRDTSYFNIGEGDYFYRTIDFNYGNASYESIKFCDFKLKLIEYMKEDFSEELEKKYE